VQSSKKSKIYPQNYPLWGIAFALVFDYTDSLEDLLIFTPRTLCVHWMWSRSSMDESVCGLESSSRKGVGNGR